MLCRAVAYLLQNNEELFSTWFTSVVKSWSGVGMQQDMLSFVHPKKGQVYFKDSDIIKLLCSSDPSLSTPAMWQLCRFFDTSSETDSALRALVKDTTGVSLEVTSFTAEYVGLFTACDVDSCSGDYQSEKKFDFQVDSGRLFVILPHTNEVVREFLAKRLRRIAT